MQLSTLFSVRFLYYNFAIGASNSWFIVPHCRQASGPEPAHLLFNRLFAQIIHLLTAEYCDVRVCCARACLHACPQRYLWNTHTHTHTFNGRLSGTTRVSRYQKGKTNPDFTETRDSE